MLARESRLSIVTQKHQSGYNCAQAVFCAYCDLYGIDEQTAYKLCEGFGSGMGGLQEVCGGLSAIFMLEGLANSNGQLASKQTRLITYQNIRNMASAFASVHNDHMLCKDILQDVDDFGRRNYPCPNCVQEAARIFEEQVLQKM